VKVGTVSLQVDPAGLPADGDLGMVRVIVGLVVVVVLLAGFLWLLKRGTFASGRSVGGTRLAVEAAISLGDRRSVVIVTVEGRRLLLGASPTQVSLLTELGRPAEFGRTLEETVHSRESRTAR
jgi:flagellar protein FliO/FliZ